MNDLTVIYYTANKNSDYFTRNTQKQLLKVKGDIPLISVSQKPIDFGENICVGDIGYTSLNIYRQALIGAKAAKTKYIAMAEDDVFYSPDHFIHVPTTRNFWYNMNVQTIYTWNKEKTSIYKNRRVLHSMLCEKELFIDAMEERFSKFPDDIVDKPDDWTEPGKSYYEKCLGVTRYHSIEFTSSIPNVVVCADYHLGFKKWGYNKKLGEKREKELPYWKDVEGIYKLYDESL